MRSEIKVGDKVAFAPAFLASIHAHGSIAHQRGWVTHVSTSPEYSVITVQWDHGGVSKSLSSNLVAKGLYQ